MTIHREGHSFLLLVLALLSLANWLTAQYAAPFFPFVLIASAVLFLLILQFFRHPNRPIPQHDSSLLYAPADGTVVVIEPTQETEYFQSERLQVSIFMSPLNVHVNRNPTDGTVEYIKHHRGSYFPAWNPKSSTENERTTTVVKGERATILIRQIAGAMARRIRNYLQEGQRMVQGDEMGFIKFGSRVDLLLPLDTDVQVKVGDKVKGNKTVIARL